MYKTQCRKEGYKFFKMGKGPPGSRKNPLGKLYPGEQHQVLRVGKKFYNARWTGPNTNMNKRLADGKKGLPLTYVDRMSKVHDLERYLAENQEDVSQADRDFLARLPKASIKDHPFNAAKASQIIVPILQLKKKYGTTLQDANIKANMKALNKNPKKKQRLQKEVAMEKMKL